MSVLKLLIHVVTCSPYEIDRDTEMFKLRSHELGFILKTLIHCHFQIQTKLVPS